MGFDKMQIIEALRTVRDPATGQDIISVKMVHDLTTDEHNINFTLELPALNSEHKQSLNFACMEAAVSSHWRPTLAC